MRFVIVATLLALALSAKVKTPTPEMMLPDVSSIKQYLTGFTEVLDIDVSDAGLKKCAKADIHFTKTLIPIVQTLKEKKYQEAIQQFVAQIKNIKQDMKDCEEIGKGELQYFGKVWKNLKEHSIETVETVAMNIAVHKDDLRKSAMKVGQQFMSQKFKQAGKTYGKMILQVFDGVDQKDAEFFNISSKNVTKTRFVSFIQSDAHKLGKFNVTVDENNYKFDMDAYMKNATKMIADYMRGISDGLEFGLTKKYINKCAKSNTDFFSQVEMPFIKLLKERNYLEAIEELVKDIPEIKKFWGDCKDYNLGFYKHILVPLANEFKHDPLGTVETVGLNIIEQFSELNETAHQVGQHFMNRSFYKAGKDYAKLVHLVLDGAINNRKPKALLRIPKEANQTLFNLTDIQKKYLDNTTDFLSGFSVGMGYDLSHKQLKTCQKANFDMNNNILSISEFIRKGEYVQLLESLAEDVTKFENDISGCRPLFQAQVKTFYIPIYESFKMHPMDTLKTLGLNILENFKTINNTMRHIGNNLLNGSFYQAGLTEADLLHIIFKNIIPDQDHDTFFDIKTTNYTNFTLPNMTKIQVQVMRGEADALGLDISRHDIQKCAAANVDMNNMMIPLFKALHDQDFAKFLLDLARDFKDFENDVKDCKEWGQAWYNGLIGPIVESFEDDAVETLKTIGLNVLENFKELRDNGKSVGVDARKQDFYEVGKDVGQIIATVFNGIAH